MAVQSEAASRRLSSGERVEPGEDLTSLSRGWSDRLRRAETRAKTQTAVNLVLVLALVALSGFTAWLGAFRQPVPYVLQLDERSGVSFGGFLDQELPGGDELIPSQLMRFIEQWRTVTPDNTQQKRNVTRLYCLVSAGAPSRDALNEYFRSPENDPFTRNRNNSVATEIRQVSKLAGATWQVEWYETLRAHDGLVSADRQTFRATLIVERGRIDRACLEGNPLGVYVQDLNWVQVR